MPQSIDPRPLILAAVNLDWPEFIARHPHLAAAIDREMLVQTLTARLADDPTYQSSIAEAQLLGAISETLRNQIANLVRQSLGILR